jgi:hypothetical protein
MTRHHFAGCAPALPTARHCGKFFKSSKDTAPSSLHPPWKPAINRRRPMEWRLICVDINPAVATKLADRGSVESTGVVTDVGLFLNLLAQRLRSGSEHEKL